LWVRGVSARVTYFFGCIYHPPKPIYQTEVLLDILEQSISDIQAACPEAVISLTGDFNQIQDTCIVDRTGLVPIVKGPTRGPSFLDRIYTSDINYENIKIVKSSVRSDHNCIVAYSGVKIKCYEKERRVCEFRRRSPNLKATFLQNANAIAIDTLCSLDDTQAAFDLFYMYLWSLLDAYFPLRKVTITDRDPPYVSPAVKSMLRQKNKLMHKNKIDEANALAERIGNAIIKYNSTSLKPCNNRFNSADMWEKVRQLLHTTRSKPISLSVTATSLNSHFSNIASDTHYTAPPRKLSVCPSVEIFSDYQIFQMLDKLTNTATGLDMLPAWFLKVAAPIISAPLTYLINRSILTSTVPQQWKSACITPIPKVPHPKDPNDFRPISITPILSRAIEKSIVRKFIYPCFSSPPPNLSFSDQYAFRPTGSTTAAIISTLHIITNLLNTNPFVHLIALDFSKAFDSVRHFALLEKMSSLSMPDFIYNWIVDFFEGHTQCTRFAQKLSTLADISASVIQGSAIGPASFLVCASDLHPIHTGNHINKYADDVYLIIPASNTDTCQSEMDNVAVWAGNNNLKLNSSKSLEMIVCTNYGTRKSNFSPPPPLPNLTRVDSLTMLGIQISSNLKVTGHIGRKIQDCNKSFFALKTLKAHGMPVEELRVIFRATTLSSLLYAAPAWWGFTQAEDQARLDAFLKRCIKAGYYLASGPTIEQTVNGAEKTLFKSILSNSVHVLQPLLPPPTSHTYKLRKRAHSLTIPPKTTSLVSKNFLIRMLYRDCY
jgi:Reverse transcriptase (RNA-dependent DNA polymerase)